MNKINWKQKLTSRKFWAAVTGFVTAILMVFKVDEMTIDSEVGVGTTVMIFKKLP